VRGSPNSQFMCVLPVQEKATPSTRKGFRGLSTGVWDICICESLESNPIMSTAEHHHKSAVSARYKLRIVLGRGRITKVLGV
jgi:hypothetical protein